MPSVENVVFRPEQFQTPDSEQTLHFFRGLKTNFDSGLRFWIKTLLCHDWAEWAGRNEYLLAYAQSGKCLPLSQGEFDRLIQECSADLRPPLPGLCRFAAGTLRAC